MRIGALAQQPGMEACRGLEPHLTADLNGNSIDDVKSTDAADINSGGALQTLTSGRKLNIRDGALQAHICAVSNAREVDDVIDAFVQSDAFQGVVSWSYAYRLAVPTSAASQFTEGMEDGLDEGCGERIINVLRRFNLQGLLLVVSRWQDYGACSGLELFGTELYSMVTERCKDLLTHLSQVAGNCAQEQGRAVALEEQPPPGPRTFDFSFLPKIPEPRLPTKFGPNHFMAESSLNRPVSLPNLFGGGGDVRLWMENDRCLRDLPESELWALRSLRQPDERLERVLRAVALLRGQKVRCPAGSAAAARWGACKEVLRSSTLRTELLLLDANRISRDSAIAAARLLEGLDVEDLRRIGHGAAALWEWARGVARWRLDGPPSTASQEFFEESAPLLPLRPQEATLRQRTPPLGGKPSAPSGVFAWPSGKRRPIGGAAPRRISPTTSTTMLYAR